MAPFYPYAPSFPFAEGALLLYDAWQKKAVDPKPTVSAAMNLVSFFLGKWDAASVAPMPLGSKITDEQIHGAFKALQNPPRGAALGSDAHVAAISPTVWSILYFVAMELLKKFGPQVWEAA